MKHDTTPKRSWASEQVCANRKPQSVKFTVSVGASAEAWIPEAAEVCLFFPLAMAANSSTIGVGNLSWQAEERPPVPYAAVAAAPSCPHGYHSPDRRHAVSYGNARLPISIIIIIISIAALEMICEYASWAGLFVKTQHACTAFKLLLQSVRSLDPMLPHFSFGMAPSNSGQLVFSWSSLNS